MSKRTKMIDGFDYGVLPDTILDAIVDGLLHKQGSVKRMLRVWGFSREFWPTDGITICGNKATMSMRTPAGTKKFSIVVTPLKD